MKTIKFLTVIFMGVMLFASCTTEQKQPEEKAADKIKEGADKISEGLNDVANDVEGGLADAMNKLENAVEEMAENSGVKKEPVNFRKLKDLMPESTDGFKRMNASGETNSVGGLGVSQAKASYEKGDKKIDLEIQDFGGVGSAIAGFASWSIVKIDKESDNGFERTTTYKGHKAYEKCNRDRCEFSVFVGKRFMLSAKGRNIEMDDLHDLVDAIGTRKLESLSDE